MVRTPPRRMDEGSTAVWLGRETGHRLGRETGHRLGRETGYRLGRETGYRLGRETGRRLGRETGYRLGRETGRRLGRETGRRLGRETGHRTVVYRAENIMEEFRQNDIGLYTKRWLRSLPEIFMQPVKLAQHYDKANFRFDFVASLTVAIVLLPQAIAYALIAELPAETGLFAAIVAGLIGGLWGSSFHLHTGPTNTTSLIVLSGLLAVAVPGTPEYLLAAGVVAVWAGVMRVIMGIARMGILVNFVSDSVVVGFTAGAGILIVVNQLRHALRLSGTSSPYFYTTLTNVLQNIGETHLITFYIGGGSVVLAAFDEAICPIIASPFVDYVGGVGQCVAVLAWMGKG